MIQSEITKKVFTALGRGEIEFVLNQLNSAHIENEKNVPTGNSLLYVAEFNKDDKSICTVSIFKENSCSCDHSGITKDKIDPVRDWFYDTKLWFRKNIASGEYDTFISYLDEYRDKFTLDLKYPLASLSFNINESN